ncbi:MAG: subtilisin [Monoraphidium minutum]|nr:MAG: subtilisin [Monoraphidium minutum]
MSQESDAINDSLTINNLFLPFFTIFATTAEAQSDAEVVPWGIPRIEANLNGSVTRPLEGAAVAVIDTGVDGGHPDLNVVGGVSWVRGEDWDDGNGHGTHVAGTIGAKNTGSGLIGAAPGTAIWALRVLDSYGSGSFSSVVQSLLWVAKNGRAKGIRVVNMSLGGDGGEGSAGSATCQAVKQVVAAGIAVVAAAGNAAGMGAGSWTTQLPAACEDIIVATAMNSAGSPAGFSFFLGAADSGPDRARQRTVAAPGVDVRSTWPSKLGKSYHTISGTSMASPHVAAVTAKCFAAGVCTGGAQAVDAVAAAARARNLGDSAYGYARDPFFARSRVGVDRYYGALVHAGWRA